MSDEGSVVGLLHLAQAAASEGDRWFSKDELVKLRLLTADAAFIASASPSVVVALIERLTAAEAALNEIATFHEPEWASEQGKAAGKEPWVCSLCGVADGHWPCDTLDVIAEWRGVSGLQEPTKADEEPA